MQPLEPIFWSCTASVAYAYAIYPPVIYVCSRLFGRAPSAPELSDDDLPTISLLIAAHNEDAVVEERIHNALAMDYPREKLQIVIASDGSDDRTVDIVRRYSRRVRLLHFSARQGKAATLNASIQQLNGDIVLLSDANTSIDPSAARNLVRWFADSAVGAVCGRLVLIDPASGNNVDSLYWRYETFLKKSEGRLGALLGSNGAIYAIRRECFAPIPPQTIVDDFVIPLLAKLRSNCTIVYDPDATANEETASSVGDEFRRRARIGAGGFQAIGMLWRLLNPQRGWIAFTFASHKIMRWLCPFFLIGAMVSCSMLVGTFYRLALAAQLAFYASSIAVAYVPMQMRIVRPLRLTTMFTSMNAALLVGFFRWMGGMQKGVWKRTDRAVALKKAA